MLLSQKYKFLFVHIAKTGGTSVRAALQPLLYQDSLALARWLCSRISHLSSHTLGIKFPRHAKVIAAKEMLPEIFFDSLYKFAFVRNPWDLQVSSYYHLKRERPYLVENRTFQEFLLWKFNPDRSYQYHMDTSIQLQSDYLIDLKGNVVVDYIGRYENLEADFLYICKAIGLKKIPKLPHKRKAKERSDYQPYYTETTKNLVWDYFKKDIELFGYTF